MSRLFVELYFDEDVSAVLTKLLRSRGFVVTEAREAGMLGCSDDAQLAYAVSHQLCLVTHNRVDFEALLKGTSRMTGSITASSSQSVERLTRSFNGC